MICGGMDVGLALLLVHASTTTQQRRPLASFTSPHTATSSCTADTANMSADEDSSDLSSLSSLSPVPSDAELDDNSDDAAPRSKGGILKFFPKLSEQSPKGPSPPPRKRSPSPPHEYVLADNPDIAVSSQDVYFALNNRPVVLLSTCSALVALMS